MVRRVIKFVFLTIEYERTKLKEKTIKERRTIIITFTLKHQKLIRYRATVEDT